MYVEGLVIPLVVSQFVILVPLGSLALLGRAGTFCLPNEASLREPVGATPWFILYLSNAFCLFRSISSCCSGVNTSFRRLATVGSGFGLSADSPAPFGVDVLLASMIFCCLCLILSSALARFSFCVIP